MGSHSALPPTPFSAPVLTDGVALCVLSADGVALCALQERLEGELINELRGERARLQRQTEEGVVGEGKSPMNARTLPHALLLQRWHRLRVVAVSAASDGRRTSARGARGAAATRRRRWRRRWRQRSRHVHSR
jgi:hypothetical protein